MSKKLKRKEFHFSLGVLFRWIIFALIIYFSINYLSNNYLSNSYTSKNYLTDINILGVSSKPVIIKATELYEGYKKQVIDYANSQFIDLKKQVVTKLYQEIINNIDNSK